MSEVEYEIVHFRPGHLHGVLALLAGLWPFGPELGERYFRWRYQENPYATRVLGIVALKDGQPAGFRGYVAAGFTAGEAGGSVGVLYPCDTVVAPEHRNRGLSLAMGKLASEYGREGFRFFLNLTSSRSSRPGYLSLGFRPLAKRVLLQRRGRNPLRWAVHAWSKRADRAAAPAARRRIRFGRSADILVAEAARPAEMAAIASAEPRPVPALRLRQDAGFFAWRYRNPVRQYAYYFLMDGDVARAYAVLDVSPDGRCGSILDYGESADGQLRRLIDHVCRGGDFRVLSALSYGIDARLAEILQACDFEPVHTVKTLLRRGTVNELAPSVLFRPVAESLTEDSFRIGALDLRKPEHWRLKPICSDGA
jgi:hypothetical protein